MNKIWIIISREYRTRVRNKSFLLSTFLFPIVIMLFIAGATFLAIKSRNKSKIAVINDPGYLQKNLESDSTFVVFEFSKDVTSSNYDERGYAGILKVNADTAAKKYVIESKKSLGIERMEFIERQMKKAVEYNMMQEKNIEKKLLDSIRKAVKDAEQETNKRESGTK